MSERDSLLTTALREVFGPLVKQSVQWPAPLAYGLPGIIAVLLIALLRSTLPSNLAWLLTFVFLAPLVAWVFVTWDERRRARPLMLTGNVLLDGGAPVKGAVVFVDGVDRKKETDETGWFQITVDPRPEWTVRAQYGGRVAHRTVTVDEGANPVVLTLAAKQVVTPAAKPPETASLIRLVPRSTGDEPPFESHQRLTTIGRSPASTICLTDPTVSWEHAQIILMNDGYHYRHVGSANPSALSRRGEEWVVGPGGREDVLLINGDRLTIGKSTFVVELDLAASDAAAGYMTTEKTS